MKRNRIHNVQFVLDSHANIDKYVEEDIKAAVFNLGYLPGSDKQVVTEGKSTITAVKKIQEKLVVGGLICFVVYTGKFGGEEESNVLLDYVNALDNKEYNVIKYCYLNNEKAPYVIVMEKL